VVKNRKVRVDVLLPQDLVDMLNNIKAELGSSRNFVIEKALRNYLENDVVIVSKKELLNQTYK